jgi:hypothetical protein
VSARVAAARAPRAVTAPRRAPAPPGRPAARAPHLRVVDRDAVRRERRVRRAVLPFAVVSVASIFTAVAFHAFLAQSQFELDRLGRRTVAAQRRYEQDRLVVATRAAPEQIVKRARELGMVPAASVRYLSPPPPEGGQASAASAASEASGADTSSTLAQQWGKVKPHLAAQP